MPHILLISQDNLRLALAEVMLDKEYHAILAVQAVNSFDTSDELNFL
jgi:hypothetical protein